MNRLATIWKSKDLGIEIKVRAYKSMIIGILIYNSETWTLTERLKNKLRAFEMGCLRKIFGVSRIFHIINTDIKNYLNIQHDIVDKIRSRHLRYFGHVVRMQPSRWPCRALYGRFHGNRHRGRPRKRKTDNISDDCQMMGLSLTQATHEAEVRRQHWLSRSSKVDDYYLIWKSVCHFLLVINSNIGSIYHCFRDMASFLLKNAHFFYPHLYSTPNLNNVSLELHPQNFACREPWERVNYLCNFWNAYLLARVHPLRTDGQTHDNPSHRATNAHSCSAPIK